jgi:hypothetical protein
MKKPVLHEPLDPFSAPGTWRQRVRYPWRLFSSENFPLPAPLKHLNLSTKIPTTTT